MKKIKYIVSTVIAVAVAALIIVGCRKENETSNIIEKQPIAKYNRENNTMSYYLDLNKISDNLNKETADSKGTTDRFLIESIEVIDEAYDDEEILPEIKVVIIDTEEEVSYTTWFIGDFTEKVVHNTITDYYLDSDVQKGKYEFASNNDDGTVSFCKVDNGKVEVDVVDNEALPRVPKWTISCKAVNCTYCHKIKIQEHPNVWSCSECTNGTCERGPSWFLNTVSNIFS